MMQFKRPGCQVYSRAVLTPGKGFSLGCVSFLISDAEFS